MRSIKNRQVAREDAKSTDHLDLSKAGRVSMPNLKFSTETISLRMPVALLNAIRREANRNDIPYQSLIKLSLAEKFGQ
jgi:predicted DNA binding CopG/RHH family protein